jgi:hypothetical protein
MKLSVFVSPRLNPLGEPQRLDTFADFLNWPQTVIDNRLAFKVRTKAGEERTVEVSTGALDVDLWSKLFKPDLYVRGRAFKNFALRNVRSFPVRRTLSLLEGIYRNVAETSGSDLPVAPHGDNPHPGLLQLEQLVGSVVNGRRQERESRVSQKIAASPVKAMASSLSPAELGNLGFNSAQELDFFQADRFYSRPEDQSEYKRVPNLVDVPASPSAPQIDFHQVIAFLGDYPYLMRRLGLVLDLEFDALPDGDGAVRVEPVWSPARNPENNPWTMYSATAADFAARSKGTWIRNRAVDLRSVSDSAPGASSDSEWSLVQVDSDGSVLKAINLADTLRRTVAFRKSAQKKAAYTTPEKVGLPALRSAGFALVRRDRAWKTAQKFADAVAVNNNLENGQAPDLWAEDLLRGYRVDIQDASDANPRWRSLCKRDGSYVLSETDEPIAVPPDEGYVKASGGTSKDSSSDLYLHETLLRWTGWSLSAPRPGRTARAERDGLHQDERIEFVDSTAGEQFGLEVKFKPQAGSLPKLRFGHEYKLRARIVDLAGNSVALEDADESTATDATRYTRFDPVEPPAVLPRAIYGEGESLECMVIRSNFDQSAEQYASDPEVVAALQGKNHTYLPHNDRHVAAPKTSQIMAETHGLLDPGIGQGKNHQTAYEVSVLEEGGFDSSGNPAFPATKTDGNYYLHPQDQVALPYLPDPLSHGTSFRGLPGVKLTGTVGGDVEVVTPDGQTLALKAPFQDTWPTSKPFRIQIRERQGTIAQCQQNSAGNGAPEWNPATRVLTVYLAKAEIARVRYSSYLDKADLAQMGVRRWLNGSASIANVEAQAAAGNHWMFTPFRNLTLVHAVQQPLCEPTFYKLGVSRQINATNVRLASGNMLLNVPSTGRIDVLADWDEPIDNPDEPTWQEHVPGKGFAAEVKIEESYTNPLNIATLPQLLHEFGDTKHRMVNYHMTATTRFREYFPTEITDNTANLMREGTSMQVNVPSSARPAAPRVLYTVPTFGWAKTASRSSVNQTRKGNGIRVYLDRPWFCSGAGELLGVVLEQSNANPDISKRVSTYVSKWGKDPIFDSLDPKGMPSASDFAGGLPPVTNVILEEAGNVPVTVVPYPVHFDSERKLWYADIEINTGDSYFPFVRLSLVRYQPNSLTGVEISRAVLADFAQLANDRIATIGFSADRKTLTVRVLGHRPEQTFVSATTPIPIPLPGQPAPEAIGRNELSMSVEKLNPPLGSDFGWAPASGATVTKMTPPLTIPPPPQPTLWYGQVTLPEAPGTNSYRLVIREYESFYQDSGDDKSIAKRLVYADLVNLQ